MDLSPPRNKQSKSFTVTPSNSPTSLSKQQQRLMNICQSEERIPLKKMKKKPTKSELQLVLQHFDEAMDKNIEQILMKHERHVIEKRDEIYAKAKKQGISAKSKDLVRLKVLADVIEYTFMNIEPPNDYTKVRMSRLFAIHFRYLLTLLNLLEN